MVLRYRGRFKKFIIENLRGNKCKPGNGCIALHYSVYVFTTFSLFEGIGARTVRIPTRFDVCPIPLENMGIELGAVCIYATGLIHSTIFISIERCQDGIYCFDFPSVCLSFRNGHKK